MGRNIITRAEAAEIREQADQLRQLRLQLGATAAAPGAAAPEITEDKYRDRLLKYIPADVVAIYLALRGFALLLKESAPIETIYWTIFGIVLVITIPWQRKVVKITKWRQIWIGSGAFIVWAISLGEPFTAENIWWYQPAYGAMMLALYTFLIPLLQPE